MKKIDPKDKPKLVALVVVAVCVFGYAVMQFTAGAPTTNAASGGDAAAAKSASGADTPATTAAAAGGNNAANPASAGGAAGTAVSTFDVADIAILTAGKDPFVPNGPAAPHDPAAAAPAPAAPTVAVAAATVAAPRPPAADLSGLMSLPTPEAFRRRRRDGGVPPAFAGAAAALPAATPAAAVAPAVVAPPPVPDYTVTGVVRDESPDFCGGKVAILRGGPGGEERRFVRCGDSVGNGFKVVAVRKDGVDIESGDRRRVTLTLGGGSRAK
jgi:hypothetical protein